MRQKEGCQNYVGGERYCSECVEIKRTKKKESKGIAVNVLRSRERRKRSPGELGMLLVVQIRLLIVQIWQVLVSDYLRKCLKVTLKFFVTVVTVTL